MIDEQNFFAQLCRIEKAIEFIKNNSDLKETVEHAKYLQTSLSRFGTLADLAKHMEVIRKYIYVTKQMFTLEEAADYLGVSKSYVNHMSANHEIRTYKPEKSRRVYIDRDDLNAWIKRWTFEPITEIKGLGLLKAEELNRKHKLG